MRRLSLLAASMLVLCSPLPGATQELQLQPLRRHVGNDAERYVARRCAALYLTAATLLGDVGDAAAPLYNEAAVVFLTVSLGLERIRGADEGEAQRVVTMAVQDIGSLLAERMRRNMAVSGSYLADDPLLRDDLAFCRETTPR